MDIDDKNYCKTNETEDAPIGIIYLNDCITRENYEYNISFPQCRSSEEIDGHPVPAGLQYLDSPATDHCTQTSKTILQLANLELGKMTPDSLSPKTGEAPKYEDEKPYVEDIYLPYNRKKYVVDYINNQKFHHADPPITPQPNEQNSLTKMFLEKVKDRDKRDVYYSSDSTINKSMFLQQSSPLRKIQDIDFKSKSYVEEFTYGTEDKQKRRSSKFTIKNVTEFNPTNTTTAVKCFCQHNSSNLPEDMIFLRQNNVIEDRKEQSFMSPTIASLNKNRVGEFDPKTALRPIRRGNTMSPRRQSEDEYKKIPYIDCESSVETGDFNYYRNTTTRTVPEIEKLNLNMDSERVEFDMNSLPNDNGFAESLNAALFRLRLSDWNISLRGLAEIVELCRSNNDMMNIIPFMTAINQRLIELLRSPRSHVCRTACQAAGNLFEYVKDTRRPEFDEIVDTLLCKTADSNKFIRQDANLALDCLVTHIAPLHTVRALCLKGPNHKNNLVRFAVARLLVCVVVITGVEKILLPVNSENTRRRLLVNMIKFIKDKNVDTRKMGERLYKLLSKDQMFEVCLRKHLDREEIIMLKSLVK